MEGDPLMRSKNLTFPGQLFTIMSKRERENLKMSLKNARAPKQKQKLYSLNEFLNKNR